MVRGPDPTGKASTVILSWCSGWANKGLYRTVQNIFQLFPRVVRVSYNKQHSFSRTVINTPQIIWMLKHPKGFLQS